MNAGGKAQIFDGNIFVQIAPPQLPEVWNSISNQMGLISIDNHHWFLIFFLTSDLSSSRIN
jgi:hypothetical protein